MKNKKEITRRFKILYLLTLELGIWEDQMNALAQAIDSEHPQAEKGLTFYEDAIIKDADSQLEHFSLNTFNLN